MKFKKIRRRGQAMVFYALLTPLLILFVGVGMDLGWYYLNVSRLQNAADAAALAGAQALVKSDAAFQNYYIVALASNQVPKDFHNYEDVYKKTFENKVEGVLKHYSKIDTTKEIDEDSLRKTLRDGRVLAEYYARKNLSDEVEVNSTSEERKKLSANDGWAQKKPTAQLKAQSNSNTSKTTPKTTFTALCITSSRLKKKFGISSCPAGSTTWMRPSKPSCFCNRITKA